MFRNRRGYTVLSGLLLAACSAQSGGGEREEAVASLGAALCPVQPPSVLEWVPTEAFAAPPANAIVTGSEPSNPRIYSCLIEDGGQLLPGKVVSGRCTYALDGRELITDGAYQILTSPDASGLAWRAATSGSPVPANAIRAGADASGAPMALCRGQFAGGRHPGYLLGGLCSIGWGFDQQLLTEYEILVDTRQESFTSGSRCVAACTDPLPHAFVGAIGGEVPADAVVVGSESTNPQIYACLASLANTPNEVGYPGKVVSNQCAITVSGRQEFRNVFQVLTAPDPSGLSWVPGPTAPADAFRAGRDANGSPFTICRGTFGSGSVGPGTHPGYIVGDRCSIGWGFQEILLPDFEVLVDRSPRPLVDLDGDTCVAACTPPASPVNGVCVCPPDTIQPRFRAGLLIGDAA